LRATISARRPAFVEHARRSGVSKAVVGPRPDRSIRPPVDGRRAFVKHM
jgi:hypothetical protein